MRGSFIALLVAFIIWLAGSAWWYTCKIKGNCMSVSRHAQVAINTLIVSLEGAENQTGIILDPAWNDGSDAIE